MTLFRKAVTLKNFDIMRDVRRISPVEEGISIKYEQITNKPDNKQAVATIIGTKKQIDKQIAAWPQNLLSERYRTLRSVPKYRLIGTRKIRIQ